MKIEGAIFVLLLILQNSAGCARSRKPTNDPAEKLREAAYARVDEAFRKAVFYKPDENAATRRFLILAPLIVQAVADAGEDKASPSRIAAVEANSSGELSFNVSRPTIYADVSTTAIGGRDYEQVVYVWWYPPAKTEASSAVPDNGSSLWRGYRLTLDREGFPMVWEVLGDQSGLAVIFVSKVLEEAAAKAFGPPLAGRRFSIERSIESRPNVVVARVLDDGPQPMGPFVYLNAEHQAVTTLICRCMPSQVHDFVDNLSYELQPLTKIGARAPDGGAWPDSASDLPHPHREMSDPIWLERALRWPEGL